MATAADGDFADDFSVELFEGDILNSDTILSETISEEQREELFKICDEIQHSTTREVIDFSTPEEAKLPQRHKHVSDKELDRLASKNSAETTLYQTKWAVTVFKGRNKLYFKRNYTKHDLRCLPMTVTREVTAMRRRLFSRGAVWNL